MTVHDERGEPVVVERTGPASYLAGGWFGGVGRYQWATSAPGALALWAAAARGVGWFLPRRVRQGIADRWAPALREMSGVDDEVRGVCAECQYEDRGQATRHAPCCPVDEGPGERPAEEE